MGMVAVVNTHRARERLALARWCDTPGTRMRGFMFRRRLTPGEGLILVQPTESLHNAGIHMWFVFTALAVIWVAHDGTVVDVQLALPWRIYMPQAPAMYVFEAHPDVLEKVSLGDVLEFVDAE